MISSAFVPAHFCSDRGNKGGPNMGLNLFMEACQDFLSRPSQESTLNKEI